MSKKLKKVCKILNYIENVLILASALIGCISIYDFVSLLGIPIEMTSYAIGLKLYAASPGIKQYKSIIKEKKKKHDKIVCLVKSKLDSIEVLISKALINLNISHDEFVLLYNVLK